ncbi:MAG: hypothetical protein HOE90_23440 [Bacteriovoracaceae bacterium]|jgi:hypothetical protein|nr:hypothetical protein [Bacteriovoracaceae bacterium]
MRFKVVIPFIVVFACGCNGAIGKKECQDYAFSSYKGFPRAANNYKTLCKEIKVSITPRDCGRAFEKIRKSGNLRLLKNNFGADVVNCFSEKDLKLLVRQE